MARPCVVCEHPDLQAINRAIVDSAAENSQSKRFRNIGQNFGLGWQTIKRHAAKHLTPGLRKAVAQHAEIVEETRDLDVLARLGGLITKAEMMLTAADEWLRDPSDPSRYNLSPRTHEVDVVYEEIIGGRTTRKTAKLSHLLDRLEKGLSITVIKGESRISDPRKLLLDAVDSMKPVLELLGKATGQIQERQPQVTQAVQVVLRLEPDQRPTGVVIEAER